MAKHPKMNIPSIPVDSSGDGPLTLPEGGVPCEGCGKPVTTLRGNVCLVQERIEGKPFWHALHGTVREIVKVDGRLKWRIVRHACKPRFAS
jgi:hypothetical protein